MSNEYENLVNIINEILSTKDWGFTFSRGIKIVKIKYFNP